MPDRPPSQIPVAVNKRASISSILQLSTNAVNTAPPNSTRATSPSALAKPPPTKNVLTKRHSALSVTGSRKPSLSDQTIDDPVQLRSQIAMLKSSLQASHERIVELTTNMNLNSTVSTPGPSTGRGGSPMPWTPITSLLEMPEMDGPVSGNDMSPIAQVIEDVNGEAEDEEGGDDRPRLPHSIPSYNLRGRAVTPGKPVTGEKASDPRLGLSRIPQSAVMHAVTLNPDSPARSPGSIPRSPSGIPRAVSRSSATPPPSDGPLRSPYHETRSGNPSPIGLGFPVDLNGPLSPASAAGGLRRATGPLGSAASTRVIDTLQTDLLNTKGHLERVKQEVRNLARQNGQLTRQTEDLKETKERMRVECEGLNNVIARKERLLQEVLERARTAEASLHQHVSNKKSLEQTTKKSLQQMTTQMSDAQAAQHKAERECNSLRDSVKSLRDAWAREVKAVREEVKRNEERNKKEREDARLKHLALVKLVQSQTSDRQAIQQLATDAVEQSEAISAQMNTRVADLQMQLQNSHQESKDALAHARELAGELVHLRRLMREAPRKDIQDIYKEDDHD